jgi:hypothetical protein
MWKQSFFQLSILLILGVTTSCYKQKDTLLEISVFTKDGAPVYQALVQVFTEPTSNNGNNSNLYLEEITDVNGVVLFNFNSFYEPGQNGIAIVKIKASKNQLFGEEIVEVIQEIKTIENIDIQ